MIHLLKLELSFLKGSRFLWSSIGLLMVLGLVAFLLYISAHDDQLPAHQMALKVSNGLINSHFILLFYAIGLLQHISHLYRTLYYKMLIQLGLTRHQLFAYQLTQILLYQLLFQTLAFMSCSAIGLFYGIMPHTLVTNTVFSSLISQSLLLFAIGLLVALISSLSALSALTLPFILYWFTEMWLVNWLEKHEMAFALLFPLNALQQLTAASILSPVKILVIGLYTALFTHLLYWLILKRNLN